MKLSKNYKFLILTIALSLAGYLKLRYSVNHGIDTANKYLQSIGGSIDSAKFNIIQNASILSHIVLGGILFLIGITFLCLSIYQLLK